MSKYTWQSKTRGGLPVANVRPNPHHDVWVLKGEVRNSDGSWTTLTWTEDGYFGGHGQPLSEDLIPLETPAESVAEPDARKALAEAAKAYKRASDAQEAAHAAERKALGELNTLLLGSGGPALVNIDGEVYRFVQFDDNEVAIDKVEVL